MPTVTYEGAKDERVQSGALVIETPDGRVKLIRGEPKEVSADQADAIVSAAQAIDHKVSVKGRKKAEKKGDEDAPSGESAS
jgi:hypothetical protein